MATDENRPDLREAAGVPEPDETDGDNDDDNMDASQPGGVGGKVRAVRERLAKRRTKKKASKLKRKRDIRNATAPLRKRASSAKSEVGGLADDLDLSGSGERSGLLSSINQILSESGSDNLQLDTDGDGFAEVEAVDIDGDDSADRVREFDDPDEPPVGAVEEEIQPLDGVEEELGLDEPIEAGDERIEANDDFFF